MGNSKATSSASHDVWCMLSSSRKQEYICHVISHSTLPYQIRLKCMHTSDVFSPWHDLRVERSEGHICHQHVLLTLCEQKYDILKTNKCTNMLILHYASFSALLKCNNTSPINLLSAYFSHVDLTLIMMA